MLFVARALDGVTGGNVSVANAYLADITDEAERSASFGKMAVSSNLGFVLGPALAGALGATALRETLPVLVAFLISVVASLIIAFKLPDTDMCTLATDPERTNVRKILGQEQKECFQLKAASKLSMREVLTLPGVAALLTLHFLVFLAFNLFYISFPIYASTGMGWSLTDLGVFFAAMGLMMVLVQGPVLKRASKIWSDRMLILGGTLVLAASFVFFTSQTTWVIYAGTALLALGNGLMWPSLLAILSKATDRSTQGTVQGFASSAAAVASITGLLVGGLLYGSIGANVFLVSAAVMAPVFIIALAMPRLGRMATLG